MLDFGEEYKGQTGKIQSQKQQRKALQCTPNGTNCQSTQQKHGKTKRQISYTFNNEKESERYVSPSFDYFNFAIRGAIKKKVKHKAVNRLMTEVVVHLVSPSNAEMAIRCLLDTGTTQSMVLKKCLPLSRKIEKKGRPVTWTTLSGKLVTEKLAVMHFKYQNSRQVKR